MKPRPAVRICQVVCRVLFYIGPSANLQLAYLDGLVFFPGYSVERFMETWN